MNLSVIKPILILTAFCFVFSACEKLEEINLNPNNAEKADLTALTANLLHKTAVNNAQQGWLRGNIYAQLTTTIFDNSTTALYQPDANTSHWENTYALARDAKTIIGEARALKNPAYEAVGLIMQAFLVSQLSDGWGDVPYTEAMKAKEGVLMPAFDKQEAIYTGEGGILDHLRKANELLKTPAPLPANADLYYHGDIGKWRKFANSLRMRYLLRISDKTVVSQEMQQIVNEEPLFTNNQESAQLFYLNSTPDRILSAEQREGDYDTYRMGEALYKVFYATEDPRMPVLFRQNKRGAFGGIPPVANAMFTAALDSTSSKTGEIFRENYGAVPLSAMIMSYAELQFVLAEASLRNLISGDAAVYYENGIGASFSYYQVDGLEDFLAQESVKLQQGQQEALAQIITQKWISNMNVGFEGWFDYRRTGFPVLAPGPNNLNEGKIPARFLYPASEQTLNKTNYQIAVQAHGGEESTNVTAWWDE